MKGTEQNRNELLQEIAILKAGYVAILNELDVMKNWGKAQLEALYATRIGRYKIELMELELELKAVKKKIQLCHQYINKDIVPDFEDIEKQVNSLLEKAIDEITIAQYKVLQGESLLSNLASPERSAQLRDLFRNIAKNLHPDVNPNQTATQAELWHIFKDAYKNGDLERLQALQLVYADALNDANNEIQEWTLETLELHKATLAQGIKELENQKNKLNADFPFTIADLIRDDDWVAEQQSLIKQDVEKIQAQLENYKNDYNFLKTIYNG